MSKEETKKNVLLKSTVGGAGPFSIVPLTAPMPIVNTEIDIEREMKHADIFVSFTAQINIAVAAAGAARLIFNLRRAREDGPSILIGSGYVFAETIGAGDVAETFSFDYVDTGLDDDEYNYSVEVSVGSTLAAATAPAIAAMATITNARLTLIAVKN